jgi:predicted dienelactone hydrolase
MALSTMTHAPWAILSSRAAIASGLCRPSAFDDVDRNLPEKHEYRVVPNSGHFAFLIPCTPALAKAVPEICTDAPDFDRVAFHERFNAEVLAFFRTHLVKVPRP